VHKRNHRARQHGSYGSGRLYDIRVYGGINSREGLAEDEYARDLVMRSGIEYDLVDLSKGIGTRLLAKLQGVSQTPALVDGSESSRLLVGVNEISRYVKEHANHKLN
jgi:hypothetical protein